MNILVVEDNEPEQVIMKEAFSEAQVPCNLSIVKDGVEAIEFLNRAGQFKTAPKPNLIILDLNMPRKNGREVLVDIKNNPKWAHIPILVFSNSESPRDICHCYSLNVNAYMNKPSDFSEFIDFARMINVFWIKLVRYCAH
jgi:two-component system, chemotaxis family, response regulator Rcp1